MIQLSLISEMLCCKSLHKHIQRKNSKLLGKSASMAAWKRTDSLIVLFVMYLSSIAGPNSSELSQPCEKKRKKNQKLAIWDLPWSLWPLGLVICCVFTVCIVQRGVCLDQLLFLCPPKFSFCVSLKYAVVRLTSHWKPPWMVLCEHDWQARLAML